MKFVDDDDDDDDEVDSVIAEARVVYKNVFSSPWKVVSEGAGKPIRTLSRLRSTGSCLCVVCGKAQLPTIIINSACLSECDRRWDETGLLQRSRNSGGVQRKSEGGMQREEMEQP